MNNNNNKNGLFRNSLFYIVIFLGIMGALYYVFGNHSNSQSQQIQSSQFVTELKKGNVKSFTMQPSGSTYKVTGVYKKAQKSKPIISGEWSLGINSSDFKQLSSLNSLYKEEFQSACRKFGEVQMKIFGRSLGWFFWTYKTETNTPYGWNFKGLVEEGNIKVKNYSDNLLARVLDFFS